MDIWGTGTKGTAARAVVLATVLAALTGLGACSSSASDGGGGSDGSATTTTGVRASASARAGFSVLASMWKPGK